MKDSVLWRLLVYFAPLSFLTVGGGTSIIADMHRQVVNTYGWLTDTDFLNLFALSRIAPGPGTILVSMIGWKVAGLPGMLVASIAIFLPSSLLVYGLASLWTRYRGARWQKGVESGLAPIAAGMLLATSFTLLEAASGGWLAWIVAIATAVVIRFLKVNPLVFLGGGGLVFLLVGL